MGIFHHLQENFNGGEWSPLMEGRSDLDKYPNSLYRLENFLIDPRGPLIFRPGWKYIAGAKYNAKASRVIPFQFSVTQAYMLEFGDYYIRFYRNQAQIQLAYVAWVTATDYTLGYLATQGGNYYRCIVAHTSGVFANDLISGYWELTAGATDLAYEIPSPYAEADLSGITYFGSADVLYLRHGSYPPRKLSRAGHTSWTLSIINFRPPPIAEQGIKPATTLTLAAITGTAITFTAGANVFLTGDVGRVITSGAGRASIVSFNAANEVVCDIIDDFASVGPIASQSWSLLGSPNGTITPSIKSPEGAICTLTGSGGSETFTNLLDHPVVPNDNWLASGSGTNEFYLTNAATFYSAVEPDAFYIDGVVSIHGALGTLGISQWGWGDNDALGYNTIYVRLADGSDPDTKSTFAAPDDDYLKRSTISATTDLFRAADVGKYMRVHSGLVKIITYTSALIVSGEILKELTAITATTVWTLEDEVWNATNGYPRCGTFFEERMCEASSLEYPETVWGSVTGDYENHTPGVDDSDAFSFTISGREVSIIRWIEPDEYLLIGSVGKISRLGPEDSGSPLTPLNVIAKRQSTDGAANIMPVAAGNAILYVQRTGFDDSKGLKIGELAWSWENEKYVTPDMTLMAEHISKTGFLGIVYQKEPNSVLWCHRYDGEVAALTYLREQTVVGWHRHPTDGDVESMATIPGDGYNEVWAVINRTVNGATVRYVEMMAKIFNDDVATYTANKGLNAFFVDCGITYNGVATTTISGLDHLNGESVVALADGSYVSPKTVSGGQITLPVAATVVHVGKAYTGTIQTMRPVVSLRNGTTQGKVKKVNGGNIMVYQSGPFKIGRDATHLDQCFDKERVMIMGAPYPLFTGDIPFGFDDSYNRQNRVMIIQDKPMPLTVVGLMLELSI